MLILLQTACPTVQLQAYHARNQSLFWFPLTIQQKKLKQKGEKHVREEKALKGKEKNNQLREGGGGDLGIMFCKKAMSIDFHSN